MVYLGARCTGGIVLTPLSFSWALPLSGSIRAFGTGDVELHVGFIFVDFSFENFVKSLLSERRPERLLCVRPMPNANRNLVLVPPAASQYPKPELRFRVLGSE